MLLLPQAEQGTLGDLGALQGSEAAAWPEGIIPCAPASPAFDMHSIWSTATGGGCLAVHKCTVLRSKQTDLICPLRCAQVEFFGSHRNMTILAPTLGINIVHRFTGHVELKGNLMGLDTFFHRDFKREFDCMVDPQPGLGCLHRTPDMLVVNSGDSPLPENHRHFAGRRLAEVAC